MTEHERNIRDIGWTLSNRGEFRAACLAEQRKDLAALKVAFVRAYGTEVLAKRAYSRFVASQQGAIATFLASE
jgi:hypothetical protein